MWHEKNIVAGILAHVDAGKTTLSEAMLYLSGKIKKPGRVDHRDSFLDNHRLERDRGITIFSKQALLDAGSTHITLMDTPGHADFSAEAERTLQVLDYAVLVISGSDGVQAYGDAVEAAGALRAAVLCVYHQDGPGSRRPGGADGTASAPPGRGLRRL